MTGQLMLSEREVPVGAKVRIHLPGEDKPDEVDGTPVVFLALYGGVPMRKKLYQVPGGIQVSEGGSVRASGLEGFVEDVRFSPVQTYSPKDAPVGGKYAVFEDGQRMRKEFRGGDLLLYEVAKGYEGELVFSNAFPFLPALPGVPVFEFEMERFKETSEEELVGMLRGYEERVALYEKLGLTNSFKSQIGQEQHEYMKVVEAIARRHRQSPADLIKVLKDAGNAGSRYLLEEKLQPTAQLVRVDER